MLTETVYRAVLVATTVLKVGEAYSTTAATKSGSVDQPVGSDGRWYITSHTDKEHIQTATTEQDYGSCKIPLKQHTGPSNIKPFIDKDMLALLLLLGFGGFSMLIAMFYKAVRKYVFRDEHNIDTVFDAGGKISFSLTAVTVTSQMIWPSAFLIASTLNNKSGLGGCLWLCIGAIIDILLFPTLSLYLKTRAPGAKTFPQIAHARFGNATHIYFCILALTTNMVVCSSALLSGKSAINLLSTDANNEFIYLIISVLFGSYCLIGGLGATFYISYFNTALTFISIAVYIVYTSFYPSYDIKHISSLDSMYKSVSCIEGPEGNYDNSFLTFRSKSGLIHGIVILFLATSTSFCDQANWQSRIAAKPSQGVLGFFVAAYMWFIVPIHISYTTTFSYLSMSAQNGTHLLSMEEIDNGYITPFVMNVLLGDTGSYLFITMLTMALMSTGSGEVMAISSIIIYDIYKIHINPFRKCLPATCCILCRKQKYTESVDTTVEVCKCPSLVDCNACKEDIKMKKLKDQSAIHYKCPYHGELRHYEDKLLRYKSWCMMWVLIAIVPFGLILSEAGMNVNWATLVTPVITSPFIIPLFLTISWAKATAVGMFTGGLCGLACSIVGMLVTASTYEGGLNNFYVNTAQDFSLLFAMVGGVSVSGILCVVVSVCTHTIRSDDDISREWAKTINIDNPLSPFRLIYKDELEKIGAGPIITSEIMNRIFFKAKRIAYYGGGVNLIMFIIVVPAIALNHKVLSEYQFAAWLNVFQYILLCCTFLVVVVPPFEEGLQIWKQYKENKAEDVTTAMLSDAVEMDNVKL